MDSHRSARAGGAGHTDEYDGGVSAVATECAGTGETSRVRERRGPDWRHAHQVQHSVSLLFVVFDIETVLIFPWTVIYQDAVANVGLAEALVPMLVFIGVLVIGLGWAWRNGAVKWIRSPRAQAQRVEQ